MIINKIYLSENNKWELIIEGIENKRILKKSIAIPPTNGTRIDIISESIIKDTYNYNCKGLIIIKIIDGNPIVELIN